VGGAELALLTLCAGWQFYGNDVTLYNNPNEGGASSFAQKTLDEFNPGEDRDVLIIFRSPNERIFNNVTKGKKVWWSCDQYTVGNFGQFASWADQIVCISPHHQKYFKDVYGIQNSTYIDLPIRTWEYKDKVEKRPKECIFTSMPDRGIMPLHAAWARIVAAVPDAHLTITSDWRLWSEHADPYATNPFRVAFAGLPNVTYKGAVSRKELVSIQQQADIHLYPCTYEELFCISVAESQVAGAFPITSGYGSLRTTNMGLWLSGNPMEPDFIDNFVKHAVEQLTNPDVLKRNQEYVREVAMRRFSLEAILQKWDTVFDA
jgi:glycosyltransferase involved in cell wall biosynthesis